MKILLWSDSYPPYRGGIERVTEMLARRLAARNHEINVVTSHFHLQLPDVEHACPVSVYRFPFHDALSAKQPAQIAVLLKKVAALKRFLQPDLVHLQLQSTSSLFHLQSAFAWDCPTVVTVHGEFGDCKAGSGTLLGSLFDKAAWISAVSTAILQDLRNLAPDTAAKSSLIYNAVELALPPTPHTPVEPPVILACGRLVPDKGFDLLLDAFHRLQKSMPAARLVIAGDGTERSRLENDARKMDIVDAVRFAGPLTDEELYLEMEAATMLVMPSRWREGFGLVAVEAALHRLPVIATAVGGLSEVVEHDCTGILVPTEDSEALRQAMLQLLRSPKRARELGKAAQKRAESIFNPENMLDQYETMYRQGLMMGRQGVRQLSPSALQ